VIEYQVPRREVGATVVLDDGRTLECKLFTAVASPEGGPQRVLERLNDSDEEFVPVACDDDRFLVSKPGIVTVQISDSDELTAMETDAGREVPVRLCLAGGISLVGRFRVVMPPERARVIDYLNEAARFVPLFGEDRVTLVQRSYIVTVHSAI
jgi:hypothetical protein